MSSPVVLSFDSETYFCANPSCQLHVRGGDPGVEGWGAWAVVDGVTYDRHPLVPGGPSFCTACRRSAATDLESPAAPIPDQSQARA
jgi:hypothetical protein